MPSTLKSYKQLNLFLIKPSKYDDDGYVIQYWKGVLPSNTLACLNGLSEDVRRRGVFGKDLEWNIRCIDETVERVDFEKIIRSSQKAGTKSIVCLVGVQSNQFPRASDIAMTLREAGIDVLLGGFHVSGVMAMLENLPAEVQALRDAGVTIVAGEVEGRWENILRDALQGTLQPVYNFLHCPPDLQNAPMPIIPKNLLDAYAVRHFATLDCGRGCPFACSFCTVINVQGRAMRFRPVDQVLQMVRENYFERKIAFYFFTDDNFSRNKNWRAIFEGLIRMRREEGISVNFMMQVDTQSHRIQDFVHLAKEAGCSQVFIGLESINEQNLQAAGKKQNKVADFRGMISLYQEADIAPHLAYIIGFPFDSKDSVAADIQKIQDELLAPQASFFMLTPLPGSADHKAGIKQRMLMDADLNNFDSFHETFLHGRMRSGDWTQAYDQAWEHFYSVSNMVKILKRTSSKKYWDIFLNFIWYKNAIQVEKGHPMIHGFVRRKTRKDRRETFPLESRFAFFFRRAGDMFRTLKGWISLAFEMEEVWLATRPRTPIERRVVSELSSCQKKWCEWRDVSVTRLQKIYCRSARGLEQAREAVPSRFLLWCQRWNVFSERLTFTRLPMKQYWAEVLGHFKQGRLSRIGFLRVGFTGFREAVLMARFLKALARQS